METEAAAGAHNNQPTNGRNMATETAFTAAAMAAVAALAAAVAMVATVATAAAATAAREIYIKNRRKQRSLWRQQ